MPIISPTAISPHRIGKSGINWSSSWATLISATVENAAPTHVVLTFPSEGTSVAADITCTVNGVARVISSASWTGGVWTIVLASAVDYGDVVVMTFKLTNTTTVTNNVFTYTALLESTGDGSGVSTLSMEVSADITVTLGSNAKFYSDAAGTLDESATWSLTAGALRTIYLTCNTGTATMTFSDVSKITKFGHPTDGWISGSDAAKMTMAVDKLSALTNIYVSGNLVLSGAFDNSLNYLRLVTSVEWIYNGVLPPNVNFLYLVGNSIGWTYNGALPSGLTYIYINGTSINWTGLDIGDSGDNTNLNLKDYRITKMSSADMITLLTQLTTRTGALPATITINDYADYASPPQAVVDAVDALKLAKSITTVNIGA